MQPKIDETSLGYQFEYEEFKLSIAISHVHLHKDGRITAEVLIETYAPGYSPLLHQSQINLLSTRSKQALCKEMETRYQAPWTEIIEQTCAIILDRVRRGEPVEYISTSLEGIKPLEYLISPIIPLNQPTAIFGLPGTTKSYLALLCGILASLPWWDNPLGLTVPEEPYRTLYLDYESSRETVTRCLHKLQQGLELPNLVLPYRRCALPLAEDIDTIRKMVEETKARFIIVDSLGGACGGDIYAPEPALRFFSALRSLNCTSLVIAHTSKEDSREKSILGTILWNAYFRQIWEAKVSREAGEDEISSGLFHRKSNEDKLLPPIGFRFTFINEPDNEAVGVEREDVKGVEGFLEHLSLSQKVLEVLKEQPASLPELAESLAAKKDTLSIVLNRLKKKGQICKLPDKRWGLVAAKGELL